MYSSVPLLVLPTLNNLQIMIPHRFEKFLDDIVFLVEAGEIPMSRIDDAVERILRVKFISGVFEHPFSDQSLLDIVGCKVTCFWFLSNFCVSLCLSHLKNDVTNDSQYVDLLGTSITSA
jgi:beta-glucosidase-like glycosyl hydrolase